MKNIFLFILICYVNISTAQTTEILSIIPSVDLDEEIISVDTFKNHFLVLSRIEKYFGSKNSFRYSFKLRSLDLNLNQIWINEFEMDSSEYFVDYKVVETKIFDNKLVVRGECFGDFADYYDFFVVFDEFGNIIFNKVLPYSGGDMWSHGYAYKDSTIFFYMNINNPFSMNLDSVRLFKHNIYDANIDTTYTDVKVKLYRIFANDSIVNNIHFNMNTTGNLYYLIEKYNLNLGLLSTDTTYTNIVSVNNYINLKHIVDYKDFGRLFCVRYNGIYNNPLISGEETDNALFWVDSNLNFHDVFNSNTSDSSSFSILNLFSSCRSDSDYYILNLIKKDNSGSYLYRIQSIRNSVLNWSAEFLDNRTSLSFSRNNLFVLNNQIVFQSTILNNDLIFKFFDLNGKYLGELIDSLSKVGNQPSVKKMMIINNKIYFFGQFFSSNGDYDLFFKRIGLSPMGFNQNVQSKINIYPNPSSDKLYLNLPVDEDQLRYELFNTNGQLVQDGILGVSIDVSQIENGVYSLRVIGKRNCWYATLMVGW